MDRSHLHGLLRRHGLIGGGGGGKDEDTHVD
jgi:hypothetical protein